MRFVLSVMVIAFLLMIPCGHCVEFYTKNSPDDIEKAPDCDVGDVCLFAVVNGPLLPYTMSFNAHITSCDYADSGDAPTRVCAKGLLSAFVKDGVPCGMNEFGIISFTDDTPSGGHAQIYGGISDYEFHVCVKPRVGCVLKLGDSGVCDADNGEKCVVGLTDRTNAHVSDCAAYTLVPPYEFKYYLCCSENNIVCERKKDGGVDYWWDGNNWIVSGPDGCSCESDGQCQSGKCLDYTCVVPAGLILSNLDDVYHLYIGAKENIVFSVKNDMDIGVDAGVHLLGVDSRDREEFMPFVWFDGHKSDEFKHSVPLSFGAGEKKYIRVVIEPAPKSGVVPYEIMFKAVSETTGKTVAKTVEFNIDQEYNPDLSFADRTEVPGIGYVSVFVVLFVGLLIFKEVDLL